MKVLILHLSDIHFEKKEDLSNDNCNGIIKALKTMDKFEAVIIIISGDIAYSGKQMQYNISFRFLESLTEKIRREFNIETIEIAIVPGNHDVDYSEGSLSRKEIEEIFSKGNQDLMLSDEIKKMNAFYDHAKGIQCFKEKNALVYIRKISFARMTIQLNLINTAAYSSLEDDQGLHYLSKADLEKLNCSSECDYIFTIMHHPHHWFSPTMKKELEKIIFEKSDIIYVGHEHYSSSMDIGMYNAQVNIFAGGELANKGNWTNSEFYGGLLELETRQYELTKFKWNAKQKFYIREITENRILSKDRINKYGFVPNENFITNMFADKKYMISKDFGDYYVFPRLEEVNEDSRAECELLEMEIFLKKIYKNKHIIILGRNESGKTVLLKQIFRMIIKNKCALFVNSFEIDKKEYESIIRRVFEEIYTPKSIDYERFKQIPNEDKVLIIDDADIVEEEYFESFLMNAEKEFGIIIYSCGKNIEFDIKERIKKNALEEKYTQYRIQAFYKDKRNLLVNNIVKILIGKNEATQKKLTNLLCEALSKQRNLFRMDPDFIVMFSKYYCNNIGETVKNDGEIFSKVFEANIVSLIKPFAKKINVDKVLIILDKIAYGMHVLKTMPISQKEICNIINTYNQEFNSDVDYIGFLDILLKARILAKDETKYYFVEQNYLAYFVAREIKRKCIEEQDFSEFKRALNYACYGINTNILLFVTYITDNINLIRMIMNKAEECVEDWEEFSISPIKIPYLTDLNQLVVNTVGEGDKKKAESQEIEKEKEAEKVREKESICHDVYADYEESELTLIKKMVRALSLLNIVSRTLPSFEHMMKREDKEKCVNLIYSLPLKIFNTWALEVENCKMELIEEIKEIEKEFQEWTYRKEKYELKDTDVLNYLRWESMSLLLEIMNVSIRNASKENTFRFIDLFEYDTSMAYRIEHLIGLDHRDAVREFVKEAEEIYATQKQQLPKLMLQRVTRHFMLNSQNIQRSNIQRLNAKIWGDKLDQKSVLINKDRNRKKEQ